MSWDIHFEYNGYNLKNGELFWRFSLHGYFFKLELKEVEVKGHSLRFSIIYQDLQKEFKMW